MFGASLLVVPAQAQKKEINEARTIIKSGQKLEQAEKLMIDLLGKSAENRQNLKIYATWYDAVEAQYIQANEKLYLKEKYDTAAFFNLTRRLYDIAQSLDSLDAMPDKKGRVKPEYRKRNSQTLNQLRPNLYSGGIYHFQHTQYNEAYDFFSLYLDAANQPLFSDYHYAKTDSLMPTAAYWATLCGYRQNDADKTLHYAKFAQAYQPRAQYVLQYQCEAYLQQKNKEGILETLREGFRRYPLYPYFFPRLADYYTTEGRNDSLMVIAEYGLSVDSKNPLFLLAKSLALLNTEKYDECIEVSLQMIAINDTLPEPYYNISTCYLNQALMLEEKGEPRKYRQQIEQLYADARPYLEKYRELVPNDKQRWAPGLYRIYLNLNMGSEFEEIDHLMRD